MPELNFPPPALDKKELEHGSQFTPKFDSYGLIPAMVVDANDKALLMFAYMNSEALALSLETGIAHFWSRSRQSLWKKGETSGNMLRIKTIRTDCDQDILVLEVEVAGDGVTCHTGVRSCFYRTVRYENGKVTLSNDG